MAKRGRPKKNPANAPGNAPTTEGVTTIDIEPTWDALLNVAKRMTGDHAAGILEELRPCAKLMDVLRQAQKKGARGVNFTFTPDDDTTYEVIR
jgi:hypothetical protein